VVVAVPAGVRDQPGRGDRVDRRDLADHADGLAGEVGVRAEEVLAPTDGEQVGAQRGYLPVEVLAARRRDADDGDHGGDADGDAERGEGDPQRTGPQAGATHPEGVDRPEPGWRQRSPRRTVGRRRHEGRGRVAAGDAHRVALLTSCAAVAAVERAVAVAVTTSATIPPSRMSTRRGSPATISWSSVMISTVVPAV
jgi:hypothetical protein